MKVLNILKTLCLLAMFLPRVLYASDGVLYFGVSSDSERAKLYTTQHSLRVNCTEKKEIEMGTSTSTSAAAAAEGGASITRSRVTGSGSGAAAASAKASAYAREVVKGYKVDINYTGHEEVGSNPVLSADYTKGNPMHNQAFVQQGNRNLGLLDTPDQIYVTSRAQGPCPVGCCYDCDETPAFSSPDIEKKRCIGHGVSCFLGAVICKCIAEAFCIRPCLGCKSIEGWRDEKIEERIVLLNQETNFLALDSDAQQISELLRDADNVVTGRIRRRAEDRQAMMASMVQAVQIQGSQSAFSGVVPQMPMPGVPVAMGQQQQAGNLPYPTTPMQPAAMK